MPKTRIDIGHVNETIPNTVCDFDDANMIAKIDADLLGVSSGKQNEGREFVQNG